MKAKVWSALVITALLVGFVSEGQATTVDLIPTTVGSVVDDAGGIADGIFDRTTAAPEIDATNNFTYRAVMEFDLSSFSIAAVNSAKVHWQYGFIIDPPVGVQLYGYAGDGVLSVTDAQQSNLIATASVPQFSGDPNFSVDVSDFLSSIVLDGDAFAGFMFKLPIEPEFPEQQGLSFVNPMLELDFTPTPLPATLPLFVSGLGAFGLLGWRRKRKPHLGT